MAEPTTFRFDLKEAAIALLRQQGIHSGRWMISIEFSLGAGITGPSKEQATPAAIVQVKSIQLVQASEASLAEVPHLAVDAAEVNPATVPTKPATKK